MSLDDNVLWAAESLDRIAKSLEGRDALERVQRDAETEPDGWASRRIAEVEREREMEHAAKLEVQRIGREAMAERDALREALRKIVALAEDAYRAHVDTHTLRAMEDIAAAALASVTPAETPNEGARDARP